MKKTILATLLLLTAAIFNFSQANNSGDPVLAESNQLTTLIINADVTVVLVNNENAALKLVGNKFFNDYVSIRTSSDTLYVTASKRRNFRNAGIIYVPATRLNNIRINSDASVRSLYALQVPKLDVIVNGTCSIAISNIGELNLIETEKYIVEQTTEVRQIPLSVLRKKE